MENSYFGYLGCGRAFEKASGKEREKQELVKQADHITLLACARVSKNGEEMKKEKGKSKGSSNNKDNKTKVKKRKKKRSRANYNSKQLDCQTVRPAQCLN